MSTNAMTEIGRQVIHVLRYSETQLEYNIGGKTYIHELPEFILATDEELQGPGLHGQPIDLGTVELPANAYISRSSIDLHQPLGFGGSVPGAVDFIDTYLNHMFQVGAASIMDLAAHPFYSELLGLKLVSDHRADY